jgi:hypothetical protein
MSCASSREEGYGCLELCYFMRTSQAKTTVCRVCQSHSFFFSASFLFYPGVRSTEVIQLWFSCIMTHKKYDLFQVKLPCINLQQSFYVRCCLGNFRLSQASN